MRWSTTTLEKLAICLFLTMALSGCLEDTAPSRENAHYEFSMENGTLEMKDGVHLAVTYYRPAVKTAGETFPVIMEMLPYRTDDFFALGDYEYGAYFAKRGYVVARVDVRGTGGSGGSIPESEYSEAEISDAEELVAQLSKKSWSNGNVGMYGLSWSAFNSLMTAHRKPPALKAIIAAHGSTDLFYNDVHYIDGALHIDSYAHQIDTGEPAALATSIHFTTWRFKPGHRIRLAVSNAQFPMIWPSPTPGATSLLLGDSTWLELPVVPVKNDTGHACTLPTPESSDVAPFGKELEKNGPVFSSVRNEQTGDSTFTTTSDVTWIIRDNKYQSSESYRWDVNDATPANARYKGERKNVFTIAGNEIALSTYAVIESDASYFHVTFNKTLWQNGSLVREKTWTERIPRRYQ